MINDRTWLIPKTYICRDVDSLKCLERVPIQINDEQGGRVELEKIPRLKTKIADTSVCVFL